MKGNNLIVMALVMVIAAGGGFFAGIKYQQMQLKNNFSTSFGPGDRVGVQGRVTPGGNRGGGSGGFKPVNGEIIEVTDKSITVKLDDGSSKIVLVSDSTLIVKTGEAKIADLVKGEKVAIFGQDNSDGSVSAKNIQLNPQMRGPSISPIPSK